MFILVVVIPFIVIFAYRQGISDCQMIVKNEPVTIFKPPDKEIEVEDFKSKVIRQNIENYDGTDRGQIEIDDS